MATARCCECHWYYEEDDLKKNSHRFACVAWVSMLLKFFSWLASTSVADWRWNEIMAALDSYRNTTLVRWMVNLIKQSKFTNPFISFCLSRARKPTNPSTILNMQKSLSKLRLYSAVPLFSGVNMKALEGFLILQKLFSLKILRIPLKILQLTLQGKMIMCLVLCSISN